MKKYVFLIILFGWSTSIFAFTNKEYLEECKNVNITTKSDISVSKTYCLSYTKGVVEGAVIGGGLLLIQLADTEQKKEVISRFNKSAGGLFGVCPDEDFTTEELVMKVKENIKNNPGDSSKDVVVTIIQVLLKEYSKEKCS